MRCTIYIAYRLFQNKCVIFQTFLNVPESDTANVRAQEESGLDDISGWVGCKCGEIVHKC